MVRERKKSWKEIDRKRDRSRSARNKKDERSNLERALEDPRMKELYLQEAEKLFMGAKGRPQHSKDLMAIHESYGRTRFLSTVCLLYTSPSPRDVEESRMPSSA